MNEFKGKKLLILGGMELLKEAIQKAQRAGITVYVTDNIEGSPAKRYADQACMVSATDIDALRALCIREEIDGIFTAYADVLLPYYAKICNAVGLPAYGSYENFCTMVDKKAFKDTCRENGVPTIEEYDEEDVKSGRLQFPVLVKPVDSSGSRGISVCTDADELAQGIDNALSYSRSKHILVEKYMTGDEIVCYYYFQDGKPVFAGMCDRYIVKYSNETGPLPIAYVYPSRHTAEYLEHSDPAVKKMFRTIGMQNGPIFLQAFFEDGKAVFYESGYRLCGAREHCIISSTTGVNSEDMLLHFAMTGRMCEGDLEQKCDPFLHGKYGCKLSPVLRRGKVARIEGMDKAMNHSSVKFFYPNRHEGDVVLPKEEGTLAQLAYRAYIVSDSLEALADDINEIQNTVHYYDEDGREMILSKFDVSILFRD